MAVCRVALLLWASAIVVSGADNLRRLGELSLEDLMKIPITTVERRELSLSRQGVGGLHHYAAAD